MTRSPGPSSRRPAGIAAAVLVPAQLAYATALAASYLVSRDVWLADVANFFRPHLLAAAIALLAAGVALRRRAAVTGGLVVLVCALAPYAFLPSPAPAQVGRPFTVVSANVLVDNRDPLPFLSIAEVASADILVLQEMRSPWQETLAASGRWPYESTRDLRDNTDMKVFSRFEIVDERKVSPQSADTGGRHPARYELLVGDRRVILYAIHAPTPRRARMWRERAAYFRDLEAALRTEPADAAVIVAGDWNMPPWSPFFRDFLSSTGTGTTESRWWPAPTRFSIRLGGIPQLGTPIDRLVVSANVGLVGLTVGPQFGSNHLPVIVRLSLP